MIKTLTEPKYHKWRNLKYEFGVHYMVNYMSSGWEREDTPTQGSDGHLWTLEPILD